LGIHRQVKNKEEVGYNILDKEEVSNNDILKLVKEEMGIFKKMLVQLKHINRTLVILEALKVRQLEED